MTETEFVNIEGWLGTHTFAVGASGRLAPGTTVGEWRVTAYLGSGLSAEVYRVANVRFGHAGALKLLTDGTRGLLERFRTEADALRFLSLRALPRFMGSGEWSGMPYYVMEYLLPLPDPMPRREVPRFMNQVAKSVQMLHAAGYIHRDLKPGNVLRRVNGEPVLIDLGLVKKRGLGVVDPIVRHGRGVSIIDGKPVGVGTLDYAAPEQLLKGEASVQSDIFALGKMLRALYGGLPPHNLKPVIRRATRELPGDRYASADDFAAAIRHRNRPYWLAGALAALVGAALAFVPYGRLLERPAPVVRESAAAAPAPKPVLTAARRENEADADYFRRISRAATDGNVPAQVALAEAYFYGRGVETNRASAVRWYRRAAEAGEADAQASLGLCLLRGWGCGKDAEEAVRWYAQAAERRHPAAMNDLAFCLMNGMGVARDVEKGFQWALRAAECGFAPAQTLVGECYLDGRGVDPDVERAETWLYRAARQGNKRAQMLLRTR